jgi:putative copper export protein
MLFLQILHRIGIVLGFGGALLSCAFMLRIKTDEMKLSSGRVARRISISTWTGLALLIISGIPLTIGLETGYHILLLVKHLCVIIIITDAFIIHFRLFPRYFRQIGTPDFNMTYRIMRRIGTLSMTCWITTMVLSIFFSKI